MLICFLSYALLTTIRFKLKISGLYDKGVSVVSALSELENIYRIYFHNNGADCGHKSMFTQTISLTSQQEKILKAISPTLIV